MEKRTLSLYIDESGAPFVCTCLEVDKHFCDTTEKVNAKIEEQLVTLSAKQRQVPEAARWVKCGGGWNFRFQISESAEH